jgi:hypothetical protein
VVGRICVDVLAWMESCLAKFTKTFLPMRIYLATTAVSHTNMSNGRTPYETNGCMSLIRAGNTRCRICAHIYLNQSQPPGYCPRHDSPHLRDVQGSEMARLGRLGVLAQDQFREASAIRLYQRGMTVSLLAGMTAGE